MTNAKATKMDHFNSLLALASVQENPELVEFLNHEVELLAKRNATRSGAMTETQKENLELVEKFVEFVSVNNEATVADVRKHFNLTAQKVSPLMTKLVNDHRLDYRVEKRAKVFFVPEPQVEPAEVVLAD